MMEKESGVAVIATARSGDCGKDAGGNETVITAEEYKTKLGVLLEGKNPKLFSRWNDLVANTKLDTSLATYSLLSSRERRREEFASLFRQSALNCLKWVQLHDDPLKPDAKESDFTPDELDVYFGDIKIKGSPCGFDFLLGNDAIMPCMSSNGGFPMRYSHVLPALMLGQFLSENRGKVDTTVICMGFQYNPSERWWRSDCVGVTCETIAKWVVDSEAFVAFRNLECTTTIRRLCIWLGQQGHMFMVVWERGKAFDVIYFADSLVRNPFREEFLNEFGNNIEEYRMKHAPGTMIRMNRFDSSLFSCSDVACSKDFACVSFVARCTVYLNTMDLFNDKLALKCIMHHADVKFQKEVYKNFEDALFKCLNENIREHGKCVWFSDVMNKKFVNIKEIGLITFDPAAGPEQAEQLEFSDINNPFSARVIDSSQFDLETAVVTIEEGAEKACTIASRFDPATHNNASMHLRSALSVVKECKGLISRVLHRQ